MKIIQLLARIEGSGVTRYIIELNKGLKQNGHDVDVVYLKSDDKDNPKNGMQNIDNLICKGYEQEDIDYYNSADLVIVNSLMARTVDEKIREKWLDLVMNKITTRKTIIVIDHKVMGFISYYGALLKNKEFWLSFDKIATFAPKAKVASKISETIGSDEFKKRYVHLVLPYEFNDNKDGWVPAEEKLRRVTYLGRHAGFKDPERLLRCRDAFYAHNYELEMRGIKRTIGTTGIPDLIYSKDANENQIPSVACIFPDKKWKMANNIDIDDQMIDTPRQPGWCYVFDGYKREDGMKIIAKSAFGCDFFHLDDYLCYGDSLEFAIFEIIDMGTIPLIDYLSAVSCFVYDKDGKNSGNTIFDKHLGIFLKKDGTNVEECLNKMDWLLENPKEYDKLRNEIFEAFKTHCDNKNIAKQFLEEVFTDKNIVINNKRLF